MRCALTLALLVPGAGLAQDVPADITAMARCVGLSDGYIVTTRAEGYLDREGAETLTASNTAQWAALLAHPEAPAEADLVAARVAGRRDRVLATRLMVAGAQDPWARSVVIDETLICAEVRARLVEAGVLE